jgi:hypothetical protein
MKILYLLCGTFVFLAAALELLTESRYLSLRLFKLSVQLRYSFFLRRVLIFCKQQALAENLCRAMLINQFLNSIKYVHVQLPLLPNVEPSGVGCDPRLME